MTIAGFYLSPEGIVLGADSTASALTDTGMHYFNFNQKIFEIGESGTLGLVTWGLGSLGSRSYRTMIAELADHLKHKPAKSVQEVAERFIDAVWAAFTGFELKKRFDVLAGKTAHDPAALTAAHRTLDEEKEFANLRRGLVIGFCIGGYVLPKRIVSAATFVFDPTAPKPTPSVTTEEGWAWYGAPNIVQRLVFGADPGLAAAVMNSGKWNGTAQEFDALVKTLRLSHASLPIRDAIDYVHSSIYCTIKALKFSSFAQICGGPIELAVITTDRRFRWVRHKPWDAAINDGDIREDHAKHHS